MPQAIADRMSVHVGDITGLDVDIIVNAANEHLLAGGGVCGAIHRTAGPELEEACRRIGHCPTGGAVLTPGFRLKARHVIHAVGPVWHGGTAREADLLASCHREALALAAGLGARQVAFPAISTGIFGYPPAQAAEVAVVAVRAHLDANPSPQEVVFCCFDQGAAAHYRAALASSAD